MGQQHSLSGKGIGIPSVVNSADGSPDNSHSFSTNTSVGSEQILSSNPPSSNNSSSNVSGLAVDQTQSVRAAIDSFIETCLAGSDEGPAPSRPVVSNQGPNSVEVITVPDEDDSDDVIVGGVSVSQESSNSCAASDRGHVRMCEGQPGKEGNVSNNPTDGSTDKKIESMPVASTSDSTNNSSDVKRDKDSSLSGVPNKDTAASTTETNLVSGSKPSPSVSPAGGEKPATTNTNSDTNPAQLSNDSSNSSTDGVETIRLKNIIERVLDTSLGGSMELKSVPMDDRVLPRIETEDRERANTSNHTALQSSNKLRYKDGDSKLVSEGGQAAEQKVDPPAICFMEHIEKAVERSFSSITEEEERKEKEKEKVLALQASRVPDNKNAGWNSRSSTKHSESTSSAPIGDGTISVQDIVDRVITQTEVVGKQPLPSQHNDNSKPMVSASGTFYPDRAAQDSHSHQSQQQQQQQSRRDVHREELPRETTGRRGRPRMHSPCPERRDPGGGQDYMSGPRELSRRGSGGVAGEDYLQSMQVALAKYGQVHPSHRIPAFLPTPMSTTASGTQGPLPVASVQSAMVMAAMGGLHPHPPSPLQPRLHAPPPHGAASSQPPPLLRVDGLERGERPHHLQPKPPPPSHPPSRSCACTSCGLFFARDAERVRMMQQGQVERGHPRVSSQPPHSYSKSLATPSHSLKWPGAELRHMEGRHMDPKQDKHHPHYPYARGPDVYPASHPAYGIQTGVPVPQMVYAEKPPAPEVRHADPHCPKPFDRAEYTHRQNKPGYEETAMREAGRHQYSTNMASGKPPAPPSHSHIQPLPHAQSNAHGHSVRKSEDPLLDLTYRRDISAPASTFAEEDKPLDLSAKKPSSPAYFYDRQDMRHRREDDHRFDSGDSELDTHGRGGMLSDRSREGEKYMPASQHLHNLETSVETHFQKLQHSAHRGAVPHLAMAQNFGPGMHSHAASAGVPPASISVGRPQPNAGRGSSVPLPPHHPTMPPSHPSPSGGCHVGYANPQPGPSYPTEPLLSPGGRRPQLHPIPAPNPSTTLGSAPPRSVPGFQSRTNSSSLPGTPSSSSLSLPPGASQVPLTPSGSSVPLTHGVHTHMMGSSPSPMVSAPTAVPGVTPPAVSSPQRTGSGGSLAPFTSEYAHPSGSRSVSPPPASDLRGEERRRGSVSKHEPIQSIIGNNNPQDILYLICRLCRQTYGSPYGFRKHFRNQHGFEPKAEHTLVQTISATKNARQMSGGVTPTLDPESPSSEGYTHLSKAENMSYPSHAASPRPDLVRPIAPSPGSAGGESLGESHSGEGGNMSDLKNRNSFSRTSTDSKGRSPTGSGSGGSVGDEREDTKCLQCPECGQTFQLNDFGSYKRHCRQHGQMRGVQRGDSGAVTQGVYACTECQRSFPDSQQLQEHMSRHQSNTPAVVCTLCRASFSSTPEYQEHARTVHGGGSVESVSSSSPVTVSAKAKVSSASSHCDISSTSTAIKREIPSTSLADSSCFNLMVTTPSDLEICRLPADPIVTSASPDSSSDNKKGQENGSDGKKVTDSSVSSSEQNKMEVVKTEPTSVNSPKPGSADGTDVPPVTEENKDGIKTEMDDKSLPSVGVNSKCNSASIEGSSSSSLDTDESMELFMYKHKKFSAHRKRSASNACENLASDPKQTCLDIKETKTEKTQQNVVSSAMEKQQIKPVDPSSKTGSVEDKPSTPSKSAPSKAEARHPLPFVWDRVTRSQAGKNARSTDYS